MTSKKKYEDYLEAKLQQSEDAINNQNVIKSTSYDSYEQDKAEFQKKQSEVKRKLDALKQSPDEKWESHKKDAEEALEEMKQATKNHVANHTS